MRPHRRRPGLPASLVVAAFMAGAPAFPVHSGEGPAGHPPDHGTIRRWIPGIPDVSQANEYSCGPAVVEALALMFGQEAYQADLARRLGCTPEAGTHPAAIVRELRALGLRARLVEGLTGESLRTHMDRGDLVILDFQAWGDPPPSSYADSWEDGHYVIAVGYSDSHLYVEDPSVLGSLAWVSWERLDERWHDYEIESDQRREYHHMAILVAGRVPPRSRFVPLE